MKKLLLILLVFVGAAAAQNCITQPFVTTANLLLPLPAYNQCNWGSQGYNVGMSRIDALFPSGILSQSHGGTGSATPSLIAGTNITITGTWPNQTINSTGGSAVWGLIVGTLSDQTDLQNALNLKATTGTGVANTLALYSGANTIVSLANGTDGHYMFLLSGVPAWDGQLSNNFTTLNYTGAGGLTTRIINLTPSIDEVTSIFHRFSPTQTATISEWRAVDETVLASVDKVGNFSAPSYSGTSTSAAAFVNWGQGTKPAAATNAITEYAPTVTSYFLAKPAAAATGIKHWTNSAGTVTESIDLIRTADLGTSLSLTTPVIGVATGTSLAVTGAESAATHATATNCSGVGTSASPSVVTCASAAAGAFSCATAATGATCTVNTSAVTTNSDVHVTSTASAGTRLGVTCNTTADAPTGPRIAAISNGVSFTINLGTVTTNPACFFYSIVN